MTANASPEALLAAMSQPYIPHHDSSWKTTEDGNLITRYNVDLTSEPDPDTSDYIMSIDLTDASKPKGYTFTISEVIERIKTCATKNYPASPTSVLRFEIIEPTKNSEQSEPENEGER